MTQHPDPQKIVALAGEGGGLTLYLLQTNNGIRFSWNSVWQIPDENGAEPKKNPNWKAQEYLSVADAMAGAPGYWVYLAPMFVRDDFRGLFWQLASTQLAKSRMSRDFVDRCIERWKRTCRRAGV